MSRAATEFAFWYAWKVKIQTSLHLYCRTKARAISEAPDALNTKAIVQVACPHSQNGAGKRTVNV